MTDRIRLDELRGRMSLPGLWNEQAWIGIRGGEFAALVEAVEAALGWRDTALRFPLMNLGDTEEGRALNALAVFDGEERV